jgi:hypothetical protein
MTDPTDETQPHPTADAGSADAGSAGAGSAGSGAVPESPSSPIAPPLPDEPPSADPPPPDPPLRADPDRPTSDWREPPWFPPRERARDRGPGLVAIVVGLGLLAIGIYYFLRQTLGVDIPAIRWSSVWPVILIVIGGLIVLRTLGRR